MEGYTVSYLPIFEADLFEAWHYIAFKLKNPSAADKLIADTEKAIIKRLETPEAFEKYSSKKERRHSYHQIQIRNFTVWYVVIDNVMEVRRFLYNKREIKKLL